MPLLFIMMSMRICVWRSNLSNPEEYLEPSPISKVKYFLEILNGFKALNVFAKISILDVLMGSEYASALK